MTDRHTEADDREIIQVTKDLLEWFGKREVRPPIAHAALLQTMLELDKGINGKQTLQEAALDLIEYIRRQVKLSAN